MTVIFSAAFKGHLLFALEFDCFCLIQGQIIRNQGEKGFHVDDQG
jgi:hypothetical protein